jgi:hypothetical protein
LRERPGDKSEVGVDIVSGKILAEERGRGTEEGVEGDHGLGLFLRVGERERTEVNWGEVEMLGSIPYCRSFRRPCGLAEGEEEKMSEG